MPDLSYTGPLLEKGQIIPTFTLPGNDNLPHSPWDYKQREHLLLLFVRSSQDTAARSLLQLFARHYKDFREEQCSLLAITTDPVIENMRAQEQLHLPYPLLSDTQGTAIARYTLWDRAQSIFYPCAILADRYNALYQQWLAAEPAVPGERALPSPDELLASLRYLNHLCTP